MVVIQLPGCKPSYHHVVVDDELAANAEPHAFMILGHDYLQDNRVRVDYDNGELVTCPPRLRSKSPKRGNGQRPKAGGRRP